MYVPTWKAVQYRKNGYSTELEQVVHTHGTSIIPCLMGWPRGLNLNRHPWRFTSVSVVSNARFYVLIYFCCVPKTCSHCEEEWQKPIRWWSTFKIDACRNLHSYMWTEALSSMVFFSAQALSSRVWTILVPRARRFLVTTNQAEWHWGREWVWI